MFIKTKTSHLITADNEKSGYSHQSVWFYSLCHELMSKNAQLWCGVAYCLVVFWSYWIFTHNWFAICDQTLVIKPVNYQSVYITLLGLIVTIKTLEQVMAKSPMCNRTTAQYYSSQNAAVDKLPWLQFIQHFVLKCIQVLEYLLQQHFTFFLILSFFTQLSILALPCNYSTH